MNPSIGGQLAAAAAGAAAIVAVGVVSGLGSFALVRAAVAGAALGTAAALDLAERRIPDRVVLPAAGVCGVLAALDPVDIGPLVGGIGVVGALFVVALVRPVALGMGDVKLALVVALGLTPHAVAALVAAILLGGLWSLALLAVRGPSARTSTFPFAPCLALGAAIAVGVA